jgi:copper resistance protein D
VPVDFVSVTIRALSFIFLFKAAGIAIFIALFGRHLAHTEDSLRRLGVIWARRAAVLVLLHYLLEAARMSGELSGVFDLSLQSLLLQSSASIALGLRLIGLVLLILAFRMHATRGMWVGVAGTTILLAGFLFVGHTSAAATRGLASLLLFAHLLTVAYWYGALTPLLLVNGQESPQSAALVTERFSLLAVWLVPGLLLAGLGLAVILLPDLASLDTTYGRLLILKVSGFLLLMLLAALNKWRLAPALARGDDRARRAFTFSVTAESALISLVLCVTAVLTAFYSPE